MTRPRHSRLTEAAVASLQDALQHVTDALSAVRDPDYFADEPDPNFQLWDDRVAAWREQLAFGAWYAVNAALQLLSAAQHEHPSPPQPPQPPQPKRRKSAV